MTAFAFLFQGFVPRPSQPVSRPLAGNLGQPVGPARFSTPGRASCASSWLILALALALVGLGQSWAWAADPARIAISGVTEPIHDITLSTSVAGIVGALKCKEGDFLKENDVLLELDNHLEELEVSRRALVMDNRKSDVDALRLLVSKSSISVKKEEIEKAETDYKIAVAEHAIALEQLRRRRLTSPYAGFIVELVRDVGEACQPYEPVARLVDTRQCYFVCNLEARLARRIQLDQSIPLEIDTGEAPLAVTGTVIFVSRVADAASGLRRIKVRFDNADGRVSAGLGGRMIIP